MVDPVLVGGAVAGVGVLTAAGYAYLSGDDASAGVDVDNDGDNEVSYTFEGNDNEHQAADGLDVGASADAPIEADSTDSAEVGAEADDTDTSDDVEEQADPTPEVVTEKDCLDDIKGIGPSRAEDLRDEGFDTPEDIYYASDANLEAVNGVGPHAVSQMREDIGSIGDDGEGNDGESSDSTDTDSSSDEESEQSSPDDTGGDGSSSADE